MQKTTLKKSPAYQGNKGGEATRAERLAHCERVRWECPYCGVDLKTVTVAIDHVKPQFAGGTKGPNNQIACCISCNSSKQAKTLADFAARKGDAEIIRRVQRALRRELDVEAAKKILKGN
jgi:5-methylcytosine-specific restriction endonuclease McrA